MTQARRMVSAHAPGTYSMSEPRRPRSDIAATPRWGDPVVSSLVVTCAWPGLARRHLRLGVVFFLVEGLADDRHDLLCAVVKPDFDEKLEEVNADVH